MNAVYACLTAQRFSVAGVNTSNVPGLSMTIPTALLATLGNEWLVTLHSVVGHVWELAWPSGSVTMEFLRVPARDSSRGGGGGINPDIPPSSIGGLLPLLDLCLLLEIGVSGAADAAARGRGVSAPPSISSSSPLKSTNLCCWPPSPSTRSYWSCPLVKT